MKKKIIVTNVIIVVFALLILFLSGISITKSINKKQAEERIIDVANIYAENYTSSDKVVKNVPKDYRVTVVDKAGKVLSDSETADVSNMETTSTAKKSSPPYTENPLRSPAARTRRTRIWCTLR